MSERRAWRHTLAHATLIVVAGATVGVGLNAYSAHPLHLSQPVYPSSAAGTATCSAPPGTSPPSRPHMSRADAVLACTECSAGFVDARGADAFAHGHIPGAVHLPPQGHADEREALETLRKFPTLVVYDAGVGCDLAGGVADRLRAAGFSDVRILEGSWREWSASGGPAQSGACAACGAHEGHEGHGPGDHR